MGTSSSSYIQVPPPGKNPFTNKMAHVFTVLSDRIMFSVNDTSSVGSFINVKMGLARLRSSEQEMNQKLMPMSTLTLMTRCSHLRHVQ